MPFFLLLVAAGVINHLIQRQQDEASQGDNQGENVSSSEKSHCENIHGNLVLDAITNCCGPGSGVGRDDACRESSREESIPSELAETTNALTRGTSTTGFTEAKTFGKVESNEYAAFQDGHQNDPISPVAGNSGKGIFCDMRMLRSGNVYDMNTSACEHQYHRIPTEDSEEEQSIGDSKNKRDVPPRQRLRPDRQQQRERQVPFHENSESIKMRCTHYQHDSYLSKGKIVAE